MTEYPLAHPRTIFIDPSYKVFNQDGLFNLADRVLNRDGQLEAFHRLRQLKAAQGIKVATADRMLSGTGLSSAAAVDYYSLGITDNLEQVISTSRARLRAFVIMEPPVVAPELYAALPRLTTVFDKVYLPNTTGDGYSLVSVKQQKLKRLHWPIPYRRVLEPYWGHTLRQNRLVVINGIHRPKSSEREQYSVRIKAMSELSKFDAIDLYGKGWHRWWSRSAFWKPYWKNVLPIMSIYKGPCESKFDVLSRYDFSLCLENTIMEGYITEKIFDCLYAGTIPLYLGAPDISTSIPPEAFIDCRNYKSWTDMWKHVSEFSMSRKQEIREAGRDFLNGTLSDKYFHSLIEIFGE